MTTLRQSGFTLAELLISLAILGIIATFTIPKILATQEAGKREAVMKEIIAALYNVLDSGMKDGTLRSNTTNTAYQNYLMTKLNATKQCSTDPVAEGCWATGGYGGLPSYPRALNLHNGASISIGNATTLGGGQTGAFLFIDWNGPQLPNQDGNDRMALCLSFGDATYNNPALWGVIRVGEMIPCNNYPASMTLFNSLFTGS